MTATAIELTAHCVHQPGCVEGDPVFGKRPSRAEMYGIRGKLVGLSFYLVEGKSWRETVLHGNSRLSARWRSLASMRVGTRIKRLRRSLVRGQCSRLCGFQSFEKQTV